MPIRNRLVVRLPVLIGGLLALYAVIPVPGGDAPPARAWAVFGVGLGLVAGGVVLTVRHARDPDHGGGLRFEVLLVLLWTVVVLFSLAYLGLSQRDDQIVGVDGRIDAFYFTTSTLATVGFGDVHAVGAAARLLVTVQIYFDALFLAVVGRLLVPRLRGLASRDG